jgi:hypothetical protein
MPDFRKQYEAMTKEELLNLALNSEQLSPDARSSLDSELLRRGIGRCEIHKYGQDRNKHKGDERHPEAAYSLFQASESEGFARPLTMGGSIGI